MNTILELRNVDYYYQTRASKLEILNSADFSFEQGALYTIKGPSGSGKTTTLSLLGALELPKKGNILYRDREIQEIGTTNYRRKHIGFVFQSFNLLNYLSSIQNVLVAMDISKYKNSDRKEKASYLLQSTGLDESLFTRNTNYLSGGEQQRVAIARAISTGADIILADEPTGNLDKVTAGEIVELFDKLAHKDGKCVIVATHSDYFNGKTDCIVTLDNKKLKKFRSSCQ
jgi:putative ABC transport system ATP-binding protein